MKAEAEGEFPLYGQPYDRWLRFTPPIENRWERELGADRVKDLKHAVIVGLMLYNAFNFSDLILLSDTAWQSVLARIIVATPATLLLVWALPRLPATWRERVAALAMVNAALIPVPAFVASENPLALYAFSQFFLSVVCANMLIALRFRHAVAVTVVCLIVGVASLLLRQMEERWLLAALTLQYLTICVFSLYANYLTERRRCKNYLGKLQAQLRSAEEEASRRRYEDLSITDALTGMPNRRLLNARLGEWAQARVPAAIVMFDIDHFKLFNDRYGHPAGDECLRQIAGVFLAVTSDSVLVARFGGEEFMIAMRGCDSFEADRIVREVLQRIQALAIPHESRRDGIGIVTASAGLAFAKADEVWDAGETISAADRALYASKKEGRNCFTVAG